MDMSPASSYATSAMPGRVCATIEPGNTELTNLAKQLTLQSKKIILATVLSSLKSFLTRELLEE
jgi:hypothetical protein